MQNTNTKENNANISPFSAMEKDVLNFWEKNKIFEKSIEQRDKKKSYIFYDGPPFANSLPHYGHILQSAVKDIIPRYWAMNGYHIERRWGWDCHGLPVENSIEKELNLKSKKDIEKIGIDKFNETCRASVLRYANEWQKIIKRIGRWVDMENDYKTMDLKYMESIWWVFKTLWDKNLIYQDYKSMHICPRCETTLSNFESTLEYKNIKDISVIAKFELIDEPNVYVLAWTTTPWTLPGNVALAINDKISYVKIQISNFKSQDNNSELKNGEVYILAKERLQILNEEKYEIIEEFNGQKLIGKKYKPLFDYFSKDKNLKNCENGWKIYSADFVTTEDGTGVVHIAPAFGEDDMNLGKENDLPFVQHVSFDGRFTNEVIDFVNMEVKPKDEHQITDIEIIKYLAKNNQLFSKEKYEHSYPHCWRCETPLLNYAANSWFVKVVEIKNKMIKNNQEINWMPEHIKNGRFGKWLENARDWAISRSRYWGTTLPVWKCEKCENKKVVGSIQEIEKLSGQKIIDLHKNVMDKIVFPCEKCKREMKRIPEVFDCWFESGSMPYAQVHYPFENKEKFEKNFPANFIAEGQDQTRGWFYTLIILSTALFDKPAFKNVIVTGMVLAEDGKKMSKRLKNYPDPMEIVSKYCADALRFYLASSPVTQVENLFFNERDLVDVFRKNIMILWNIYKFYELYVDKKTYNASENLQESATLLDKWILAELNVLTKEVTENMENYNLPKAIKPISDFINNFSTWYIRRSRNRFKSENFEDQKVALQTTSFVLIELSKIIAPIMPFLAETIWQKVNSYNFEYENKSVHLTDWVKYTDSAKESDVKILKQMQEIRKIVELGLKIRDEASIKVRQTLSKLKIKNYELEINEEGLNLIKDELNVKEIEIVEELSQENNWKIGEDKIKIAINIEISEELKLEGLKREIARQINMIRKQAEFTIKDKIILLWQSDSVLIKNVFNKMSEELKKDTLSEKIIESDIQDEKININGEEVKFKIEKV